VSSLESFQRYHAESAQVWERQALIKARVVYGPPPLAACIERVVEGFVYRSPLRPEEAREIRRLRGRMERELARESAGHVNIKTGRGGLVDIEFLVQMLQLSYGPCLPAVRCRATRAALDALYEQQVIPEEVWHILSDGYRFLRRLEQTLRLIHDRAVEDLERADMDVVVVGRRLGLSGEPQAVAEQLWAAYTARREAIRRQYETWFERAEGNELPRVAGCP
jgi:glutamate-ammonia-ligase adenylyltransferase